MTLVDRLDTCSDSTDTSPQVSQLYNLTTLRDWWRESAETQGSKPMSIGADPIDQAFVREIVQVKGVEEIRRQDLQDPRGIVYWVVGSNFTADEADALIDATWRVIQRFPGCYIDIRIDDRYDAPRRLTSFGERLPVVYPAFHASTASGASYRQ